MKNKFRRFLSTVIFSFLAVSSVGTAAYELQYEGGESDFTLSGKAELEKAGQIVTLKVEKEGELLYIRQTETNADGTYSFVFNISPYGEADVTVSENGSLEEGELYKSTPLEVETALSRLNSTESENDIINDTGNKMDKILQVSPIEFNSLKESGLLAQYLADKRFSTLSDFLKTYKSGEMLVKVEASTTSDEVYSLIEEYDGVDLLGDFNAADIFVDYNEETKKEILENVKGKTFVNDEAFQTAILDAVIISELGKMTTDNEKWNVISQNNDYLEMNISKYEGMSKFTKFKENLFKNSVTSVSTMKGDAESLYEALSGGGPGGDGGSGSPEKTEEVSVSTELLTPQVPSSAGFTDIGNHEWAKSAILSLAADGVINGKGNNKFAPDDYVTRAEFTKIIIGAFDLLNADAEAGFDDVTKEHWSYRFVASALENGIVTGVTDSKFNPGGNITRQDMAVICHRVLEKLEIEARQENSIAFADAGNISEYAKSAVDVLSSIGIINGKGNNKFAPKDFATRAEAAKIIYSLSLIR